MQADVHPERHKHPVLDSADCEVEFVSVRGRTRLTNVLAARCGQLQFHPQLKIRFIRSLAYSLFDSASAQASNNLWDRHVELPGSSDERKRFRANWTNKPHSDRILRQAHTESEKTMGQMTY
jgi:hypothetical protein